MRYSFEAKNSSGSIVTGALEATDERTAARQIRDMGHFPVRVTRETEQTGSRPQQTGQDFLSIFWTGVSPTDLALCYRQWASLLSSGVPMLRSLEALARTQNGALQRSLKFIAQTTQSGGTISEGMARFPLIYTELHRAMIRTGEMTGGLDTMFRRLADAQEQEIALRRTLKRETLTPKLTLAGAFLLPPLAYLILDGPAAYVRHAILPLAGLCAIVAALWGVGRLGAQRKAGYDRLVATMPGIGKTTRLIAMARFARALASLYGAGVGMGQAVQAASAACGNTFLGNKIAQSVPEIEAGQSVAFTLSRTGAVPEVVLAMIETGEETGRLDTMLDKVAEHFEQDAALRLHQTGIAIGVATLLIVGAFVGFIVIQSYTGYFSKLLGPG